MFKFAGCLCYEMLFAITSDLLARNDICKPHQLCAWFPCAKKYHTHAVELLFIRNNIIAIQFKFAGRLFYDWLAIASDLPVRDNIYHNTHDILNSWLGAT